MPFQDCGYSAIQAVPFASVPVTWVPGAAPDAASAAPGAASATPAATRATAAVAVRVLRISAVIRI